MTQIVSSISGIEIYAPSAGNAPTNSSEVSAIASAYQVVSATAAQLYAGTSFLTSVNSTPVSASRAGNAANASLATSAWYDGTGRLISALPDNAAVSSIASGYVTGVSATVANNSASWGGGGGSVVSPSGTIVVMNGNEVEGTNSAAVTGLTGGYNSIIGLIASVVDVGPSPVMLSYYSLADEYTGGNFALRCNSPIWNTVVFVSGRDSTYGTASASASAVNGDYDVLVPQGPMVSDFMAWTDGGWIHVSALEASAAPSKVVTDIGELAWNSALTGVSATVANNSASWGQGGVPASTVSSIASSYAESAASSKLDISLIGSGNKAVAPSGEAKSVVSAIDGKTLMPIYLRDNTTQFNNSNSASFYYMPSASPWTTAGAATGVFSPLQYSTGACLAMDNGSFKSYFKGNEWFVANTTIGMVRGELHASRGIRVAGSSTNSASGFQIHPSGVNGKAGSTWQYGTAEYNMLTSVNDTVSANSASWGQGGVDSATVSSIASSYAQDVSAAVSGTVDTVSAQSANWGGSALALSAGPGVKLEKVGDTLVVSTDETLLWSGEMSVGDTAEMAAPLSSFERVKITWRDWSAYRGFHVSEVDTLTTMYSLVGTWYGNSTGISIFRLNVSASPNYSKIAFANGIFAHLTGSDYTAATNSLITKVVGVNRTAGV